MRILAVDDDEFALEILTATLQEIGYSDVVAVRSGRAAQQRVAAASQPFECFLLDIQMPQMDGIELCGWLRREAGYKSAPIIMITAMSQKSFVDSAFAAGATDYVTKPFDPLELGTRVKLAEQQYRSSRALKDSNYAVRALGAQLEVMRRVGLDEAIHVDDVPGVIDLLALENYVLQTSRGGFVGTGVFSFHIHDVARLHARFGGSQLFRDILSDVAECAVSYLKGTQNLIAYAGRGSFVCVASDVSSLDLDDMGVAMNQMIEEVTHQDEAGETAEVRVSMGEIHELGAMASGRRVLALVQTAIRESQTESLIDVAPAKGLMERLFDLARSAAMF